MAAVGVGWPDYTYDAQQGRDMLPEGMVHTVI